MRCLTILLACGWLLMLPFKTGDQKADPSRPISEWTQDRAFDTAKECENHRSRLLQLPELPQEARERAYIYARCLPSDWIGFKPN